MGPDLKDSKKIDSVMLLCESDDSLDFAYMAFSLVRTCEPLLSFDEAKDVASDITEDMVVRRDGLIYTCIIENDTTILYVEIDK